jgi:hypothetical protein
VISALACQRLVSYPLIYLSLVPPSPERMGCVRDLNADCRRDGLLPARRIIRHDYLAGFHKANEALIVGTGLNHLFVIRTKVYASGILVSCINLLLSLRRQAELAAVIYENNSISW